MSGLPAALRRMIMQARPVPEVALQCWGAAAEHCSCAVPPVCACVSAVVLTSQLTSGADALGARLPAHGDLAWNLQPAAPSWYDYVEPRAKTPDDGFRWPCLS